jgi:hypothetical protein
MGRHCCDGESESQDVEAQNVEVLVVCFVVRSPCSPNLVIGLCLVASRVVFAGRDFRRIEQVARDILLCSATRPRPLEYSARVQVVIVQLGMCRTSPADDLELSLGRPNTGRGKGTKVGSNEPTF